MQNSLASTETNILRGNKIHRGSFLSLTTVYLIPCYEKLVYLKNKIYISL